MCVCSRTRSPSKPPLKSIVVGGAFKWVGTDFKEIDKSNLGHRYAVVLQDCLTTWPKIYAVRDRKCKTVAKCLMDFIYKRSVPDRITHDRAAEFFS